MRHVIYLYLIIMIACGHYEEGSTDRVIDCIDGCSEEVVDEQQSGPQGPIGPKGQNGKDGDSCSLEQVVNGALISCGGIEVVIVNGQDGKDAETSPYQITELVDPCDDGPGFDEILIKTYDNTLIAYFEVGSKRFLSKLSPGNYVTTDPQSCQFSVDSNLNVNW